MNSKEQVLKNYFGHSSFRNGQSEIISELLSGRDVVGIMPTGAGKSICYQIPALMMPGITLVISPLISLMKDQVTALIHSGVKAAYLNSSLTYAQYIEALRRAKNGAYKIIYVAPERLSTEGFINFANSVDISMITVDEAHCISQWGNNFRPEYRNIKQFIDLLKKRPVVSAFTATATKEVKEDIVNILELKNPFELVTGFDRENLFLEVVHTKNKFAKLYEFLKENENECIIIYCGSRKTVEEVCEKLCDKGFSATRYHAGLEDAERRQNQEDFQNDLKNIMVATNAFGMGIDKSNVRAVIHYNMPKSVEGYYQEAGRAGRDGLLSKCLMLYSPQDIRLNKFLIESSESNPNLTTEENELIKKRDMERLKAMINYSNTTSCLRKSLLEYFGEKAPRQCNSCSSCTGTFVSVDITEYARKILFCLGELENRHRSLGRVAVSKILHGSEDEKTKSYGVSSFSSYAILSNLTEKNILTYIDAMLEMGYIIQKPEFYNVISLTEKGKNILKSGESISIRIRESNEEEKIKKKKAVSDNVDTNLFEQLKKLRTHLASKQCVPPYVIFSDMTLRLMSDQCPVTDKEFLQISGVGKLKLQKYGKKFMDVIRKYKGL